MFVLGVDSTTNVSFEVEYDYKQSDYLSESSHVTRSGKRYSYVWARLNRFEVPLRYVDSATAATINSWWSIKANLLFVESGAGTLAYTCQLVNDEMPLGQYERPYTSLFRGTLELESY